jgi:hypothetical protein
MQSAQTQPATVLNVDRPGRRFALMSFVRGAARIGFLMGISGAAAAGVGSLFVAGQPHALLTHAIVGYLLLAGSFFVVAAAFAWDDGSWPVMVLWPCHLGLSVLLLSTQSEIAALAVDPQRDLNEFIVGMVATQMQDESARTGSELSALAILLGLTTGAEIALLAFSLLILGVVVVWRRIRRGSDSSLVGERFWLPHALGSSPGLAKSRTGKRSIPLLFFLGALLVALSAGATLFVPDGVMPVHSQAAQMVILSTVTFALFLGGAALLELAERRAVVSARTLISIDRRPPILFLRSFQDDRLEVLASWFEVFSWLMTGLRLSLWNDIAPFLARRDAKPNLKDALKAVDLRRRSLEDILLLEFSNYGPIVAIGDPRHKSQFFGAARDFYDNDEWQQAALDYMRNARAIIIALDNTEGVVWEIETLARENFLEKTLFLCPARFQSPESNRQLWQRVSETLARGRNDGGRRDSDQPADPGGSVLARWTAPAGRDCLATAQEFSYNRYYVTLRWFFRTRWGEMNAR